MICISTQDIGDRGNTKGSILLYSAANGTIEPTCPSEMKFENYFLTQMKKQYWLFPSTYGTQRKAANKVAYHETHYPFPIENS